MSRSVISNQNIFEYAVSHSTPPDGVLQELIDETRELTGGAAGMQIGADQGAFMTILSGSLRPRFAVEVGTFTGYSSICIARGLAPEGKLLCCDVSEEWTDIAQRYWSKANLSDKIDLVLAPGVQTLKSLPSEETIDLAFIDADKGGYTSYYEEIVPRLSPQGILLVDNTLWSGRVIPDSGSEDEDTLALRAFNDHVVNDPRVAAAQLTVGDGLTVITKV